MQNTDKDWTVTMDTGMIYLINNLSMNNILMYSNIYHKLVHFYV